MEPVDALQYPANDFIVLDVLMWALIVLFECHYVQAGRQAGSHFGPGRRVSPGA